MKIQLTVEVDPDYDDCEAVLDELQIVVDHEEEFTLLTADLRVPVFLRQYKELPVSEPEPADPMQLTIQDAIGEGT